MQEPLDLQYETWFPTNWFSANLRHTITVLFTTSINNNDNNTSMEVDQVSDGGSNSDSESTPYFVETPSSDVNEGASPPLLRESQQSAITMSPAGSNALLVYPRGALEPITSVVLPQGATASPQQLSADRSLVDVAGQSSSLLVPMEEDDAAAADHAFALPQQQQITAHRSIANINESIISLLIKLHSKLSGKPASYLTRAERAKVPSLAHSLTREYKESRIGDGCFFVEKVLDKICELDSASLNFVNQTKSQLWPTQEGEHGKADEQEQEREEIETRKRRRAKERQAKLMKEYAERQQRFMRNVEKSEDMADQVTEPETTVVSKEYTCVHCHQTQPSTLDKPVGLVVLLQATSVLGHQHQDTAHLHLNVKEEDHLRPKVNDSLAAEYEARYEELAKNFDFRSYLLSVNAGWQGGVSVQSCGHHVHLSCQHSYMASLRSVGAPQGNQTLAVDKGEYMCPMCRQLANGVLPIPPDHRGHVVRARSQCPVSIGNDITAILKEPIVATSPSQSQLMGAMNQIMENLRKVTYPQYTQVGSDHAVVMFVSSVARTNLELDLVARGNALLVNPSGSTATAPLPATMRPKSCFTPLFQVLATHTKIRSPKPLVSDWCHVTGLWQDEDDRSLMLRENDVPLILRDPTTMLLHFALILPVQIDRSFFVCLVRQLYNLSWVQACLKTACRLPTNLRLQLKAEWDQRVQANESQAYMKVDTVALGLGIVASLLDATGIFNADLGPPGRGATAQLGLAVTLAELEQVVQAECLGFMRIAAILRHHLYEDALPDIWEADWEFTRLAQFLGMADVDISGRLTSGPCLGWLTAPTNLCFNWCTEVGSFARKSSLSARKLILVNSCWKLPQLLRLPKNYDAIFQVSGFYSFVFYDPA